MPIFSHAFRLQYNIDALIHFSIIKILNLFLRQSSENMSIRNGLSVGRTTGESSLTDQLKQFTTKKIAYPTPVEQTISLKKPDNSKRPPNPSHESLKAKCMKVVVDNFERKPITEVIPPYLMSDIVSNLPSTLSPVIGARYIYNENYWKRCCVEKFGWHHCHLTAHGYLWKQMYFETLLQERLEGFDAMSDEFDSLLQLIDACMDYIFTVTFKQLPSHIDVSELCAQLPNLAKIDFTFGVKKIGMNYEVKITHSSLTHSLTYLLTHSVTHSLHSLSLSLITNSHN